MTRARERRRRTLPFEARCRRPISTLLRALAWTCVPIVGLAPLGACSQRVRPELATAAAESGSPGATGDEVPEEPSPPPPLEPRVGATVSGTLRPGETVVHTLHLDADDYVEVYFDHTSDVARFRLYTPADLADEPSVAIGWGEYHADPKGQSLWGLSRGEGEYQLEVRAKRKAETCSYSMEILALHAIGEKELAKQEGEVAWEAGVEALSSGRHEDAVAHLRHALDRWSAADYTRGVAASYERMGRSLRSLGHLDAAIEAFQSAIETWRLAHDFAGIGNNAASIVLTEIERGGWESAFRYLQIARDASKQSDFPSVEGEVMEVACSLHLARGETGTAHELCLRALNHYIEHGAPERTPGVLNNLGLIHRRAGELEEAGAYYDNALQILTEYPDPLREAVVHRNLGTLQVCLTSFEQALKNYQHALDYYEASGNSQEVANTLYAIGTLHEQTGDLTDTLLYYRRALEIQERLANPKDLVSTLYGIGWVHLRQGELVNARDSFERALQIGRASRSKAMVAWTLEGMADLQLAEGKPNEAIYTIDEALEFQEEVHNRWEQARLINHLSRAQLQLGRPQEALETLGRTAQLNQEIGNRRGLAASHYRMAQIHRTLGDLEAARRSIDQALSIADGIRHQIAGRDMRTLVGAKHQDYHEFLIDLLMEQNSRDPSFRYAAEALQAAERARAQSLLEVLAGADFELGNSVPPELASERERIRKNLAKAENHRANLLQEAEGDVEPAELFGVKAELDRLLAGLAEIERRMREASPSYAALTRPEAVSVTEIQRSLLDQDTALLEYRLGEERSFLFAVTPKAFLTFELPGKGSLEEDARCVHWLVTVFGASPQERTEEQPECLGEQKDIAESLAARNPFELRALRRQRIEQSFTERMAQLSEKILGKASRAGVLGYSRLVIVADGALEYSPLSALPDPSDGQPLIVHHEITRLPSASFLAFHRRDGTGAPEPQNTLAVIADPVYGLDDDRLAGVRGPLQNPREEQSRGRQYARLPFASEEARAIAAFSPPDKTLVALGQEATRTRVLDTSLSDYRYIHFATHGEIDTHYPQLSGLALSIVNESDEPTADDFLRLHDVYEMRLNADMVVLSACETALGREIRGEGLVGLARGFMYAGAERVVASLWQVQDRATAELMEHFYYGLLKEGRRPADALRHAQIEMLSEPGGRYSFPYYWAGFVLQGDWR